MQGLFDRAEEFIWRNARLVDRRRFSYLFKGGPKERVLTALLAYRNEDGGFGNALEPDVRCPDSQPVTTQVALEILDEVGYDAAVAARACDFLAGITSPEGGVPYALPSIEQYPRAPWWNAPGGLPASVNPTAGIVGLMMRHGFDHPWVARASEYCWRSIEETEIREVHELLCAFTFLEHAPDRARAEREIEKLGKRILDENLVALDPDAPGYIQPPLNWAPAPERYCRRLFSDDLIAAHLNALEARQQPDGGWAPSWEPISPGCEAEWRGSLTVGALKTLRAYGRSSAA